MAGEGIEIEVYHYRDPNLKLDTIEGRQDPKYLEELDDVGAGSFKVARNDPKILANPNLLKGRNVCKYRVDGRIVGAFLMEQRKGVLIGDGEDAEAGFEVSGRGLMGWFSDAVVYPWAGLGHKTRDKRSFSFASPTGSWYKSSQWIEPKASMTWTKITGNPWKYQPTNWPADLFPHARWVWGTANADDVAPEGTNYFRWTRTFSEARKCSLYITADNSYQVYLDGEQIAESDPGVSSTYECQKIDFDVDFGDHIIGIVVTNGNAKVKNQHAGLLAGIVYYTTEIPDTNLGTVTVDIHENARVHRTGHGLQNDDKVYLSTTGQLPEGLSANSNYYVADRDANSFTLQKTTTGVYIDTKGAQSGTHTLFKAGSEATPKLLSYTGMTDDYVTDGRSDAKNHENALKSRYDNLPAGATTDKSTKKQKQQAKVKAAAKTLWQKAVSLRKQWDTEVAAVDTSQQWRVLPYPSKVPGWTPGEILLKLLAEATARGVLFPSFLHPTFTATKDSKGVDYGDAIEWTFDVGTDNLLTVVQKMEELQVSVWIDPVTMNLNMAQTRGTDRAGDANAVVFEQGKNIRGAETESRTKIKNSLLLKTNTGWASTPAGQIPSQSTYGVIEDVLDYDGKESVARSLASSIFNLDSTEEEGATYDIFPTDKFPFLDFYVGDWVSAPNERNTNVKRRVSSLSIEEDDGGIPQYSAEFDTIFHYSEDRINRILQKMGQRGATGGSGIAAGGQVPASQSNLLLPPMAGALIVPLAPTGTVGYPAATWDLTGTSIIGEAVLTWDPVDQATDGSQIVVPGYSVYARQTLDADDPDGDQTVDDDWAMWTQSATTMAVIQGFVPGDTWEFQVAAQSPYGSNFIGDFGDVVSITMGVPTEPMDPPTPPEVDSKLGVAIIRWDGQLKDVLTGSIHNPDPQFKEIEVGIGLASGGPYDWTRGTPITLGGLECYVTGYDVGTHVYAVMRAVDGIGIKSDISEEGNGIIKGVDLGSLAEDLKANLEATQNLAGDAQNVANQALDLAQDSADRLTKITYSTIDPTVGPVVAGHTVGDTWFRYSTANALIGQWRWDGTIWQPQVLTNTMISTLDAGKITTGTLDAARIAAQSITVTKLAVADFTNLLANPRFDPNYPDDWTGTSGFPYTGNDVPVGRARVFTGRDHVAVPKVPAKAGDSFYLEFSGKYIGSGAGLTMAVWMTEADGSDGLDRSPSWASYQSLGMINRPVFAIADLGNGWTRYGVQVTIDPAFKDVAFAQCYIQIDQNASAPVIQWVLADLVWRRASNANLIVDGSIQANHLGAGSVTTDKLSANSVVANKIAVGSIETNKIAVGAIDGIVITGAVFRTNNNPGYTGVQLDSTGLHAWINGNIVFDINTNGNIAFIGAIIATSGTFNGVVNAQSGNISGQLTIGGGGSIYSEGGAGLMRLFPGYLQFDGGAYTVQHTAGGSQYFWNSDLRGTVTSVNNNFSFVGRGETIISGGNNLQLLGAGGASSLYLGFDGSSRMWSDSLRSRQYGSSDRTSSTGNQLMVLTSNGTFGVLTSVIASNYLSSSSRRFKYDIEDYDPAERVLQLQPKKFKYLENDAPGVGMIAEEVAEAGFEEFVARADDGQIETINYLYFGAALLSLAKAQQKRIEALEYALNPNNN